MPALQPLTDLGAWLGSLPMVAQILLYSVYGVAVPVVLMFASFVGNEGIIRDARSASGESGWALWLFECVRRRRLFWVLWVAVATVTAADVVLMIATPTGKNTFVGYLTQLGGIRTRGWPEILWLVGVAAGMWMLVRLPKARRCAIDESGEA